MSSWLFLLWKRRYVVSAETVWMVCSRVSCILSTEKLKQRNNQISSELRHSLLNIFLRTTWSLTITGPNFRALELIALPLQHIRTSIEDLQNILILPPPKALIT